jgi:hypothetical protein
MDRFHKQNVYAALRLWPEPLFFIRTHGLESEHNAREEHKFAPTIDVKADTCTSDAAKYLGAHPLHLGRERLARPTPYPLNCVALYFETQVPRT